MPMSPSCRIVLLHWDWQSRRGVRTMAPSKTGITRHIHDRPSAMGGGARGAAVVIALLAALATLPAAAGDAARGRTLAGQWCINCHLIDGSDPGRASDAAPPFTAVAADPAKGRAHLETWLATPHAEMPLMPLSRRNIDDLVTYIESLAP